MINILKQILYIVEVLLTLIQEWEWECSFHDVQKEIKLNLNRDRQKLAIKTEVSVSS